MQKPKLAFFSPLPPTKSGIADYSAELLPFLAQKFDITIISDQYSVSSKQYRIPNIEHQLPITKFLAHRHQFDLPVYQMGNSEAHEPFYELLLQQPGLVVLHDFSLHHFVGHRTAGQGKTAGYSRELAFAHGAAGRRQAWQARLGKATADSLHQSPLNERVLAASLGLIAHSNYVKQKLLANGYQRPIILSSQPMVLPAEAHMPAALRRQIDVPPDALLLASVGQITPAKQIGLALRAFAKLLQQQPTACYLLVGEPNGEVDLARLIGELGIEERVRQVGFAPDLAQFVGWIKTADFIINLRHPTVGETSATALRALAAGRPVLLFDHGWYAELPDKVAVKVPPLDEVALLAGMVRLSEAATRQKMGEAALRYAAATCAPQKIVQDYVAAYEAIIQRVGQQYA